MILHYIKSAVKSIYSNRKFTLINILGFSFAISVCLAITLFILKEYSYDSYHENGEQIVRLIDSKNKSSNIDYRVKNILIDNFPEIENACLVQRDNNRSNINIGEKALYVNDIMSVDNDFFKIFSIKFIAGQADQAFANINSVVLTEKTAQLFFGEENPIGKEILYGRTNLLSVTAVIEDFPENSSISAGIIVNAANDDFKFSFSCENYKDKTTHRWEFRIYALLNNEVEKKRISEKINDRVSLLKPYVSQIDFLPLEDIYLRDETIGSETKRGNSDLLQLLGAIAIIILSLAIVNYINLTLAQQKKKNKLTGLRKSFGASNSDLLAYFIIEAIIISLLSFILSAFLVWIFSPFYSSVFATRINVDLLQNLPYLAVMALAVFVIGFCSGIGPAIILSKKSPNEVINQKTNSRQKQSYMRNALIVFQFTASIILIICLIIVQKQIIYVKHKDPGFAEKDLLNINLPYLPKKDKSKAFTLAAELRKNPLFKKVSLSNGAPGSINFTMGSGIEHSDKNTAIPVVIVDTNFISTFQLQIIKGRGIEPGDFGKVCMVNEAFYKHFEFENLSNKRFKNYTDNGLEIIGVVKDFQYGSLHNKITPLCILFAENNNFYQLSVKTIPNSILPAIEELKKTWQTVLPEYPLQYQFFDDWFDALYEKEERFAKTIGLFALLAIAISCFGIFGLAIFSSEQRTKEIGIRKTNGAKTYEIIRMLNNDFLKWVFIAFVIASPIAYIIMQKWLENFAYKTELNWWIFALAGLIAMGIALLTVSFQSWRAATRNPVESLRYE